jgi:V/A-type H+-transporting ATPase subunit E
MTGLEKIVASIREEALGEAKSIVDKAKADAARMLADEKAKSSEQCAQIEASAKRQAEDIERAGISALELQRRRKLLEAKQELLTQTMELALSELYELPDEAYFELLLKMAGAFAEPQNGQLLLSQKDIARCPGDFEERLNGRLPKGVTLGVSQALSPIDGGFILKYGDIEQNCTFRAVFDARWDELTDKAREILFS